MSALYDMLGINEAEGIDLEEVERIKSTLTRIKVVCANVAQNNPTRPTLEILDAVEQRLYKIADAHTADEALRALGGNVEVKKPENTPAALPAPAPAPKPFSAKEALEAIMADASIPRGLKALIARAFDQTRPDSIAVGDDGTPSELANTRAERDRATAKVADLERQLKAAKASTDTDTVTIKSLQDDKAALEREVARLKAARPIVGDYDRTAAKKAANAVLKAVDNLATTRMSIRIDGVDEVDAAFDKLLTVVGLEREEEN